MHSLSEKYEFFKELIDKSYTEILEIVDYSDFILYTLDFSIENAYEYKKILENNLYYLDIFKNNVEEIVNNLNEINTDVVNKIR